MGKELQRRLLEAFKGESGERLQSLTSGLLELEKSPSGTEGERLLESIYREAHSLKGAARAVSRTDIEGVCQSLESVFALWKREATLPPAEGFDILHRVVEGIEELLGAPEMAERSRISALIEQLRGLEKEGGKSRKAPQRRAREEVKKPAADTSAPAGAAGASEETVRIATAKLSSLLSQAEEMLTVKLSSAQLDDDIRTLKTAFEKWQERWQEAAPLLDRRSKGLADFVDWQEDQVKIMSGGLAALARKAEEDRQSADRKVDNLLEDSKQLLLFPVSSILQSFPKMVRDLCREQEKEARLVIEGGELEVDKRVLEEIKDPLMHLVRNCVDHGLEKPEQRERKKKPREGTITVRAVRMEGDKVEITICDDGGGLDHEGVKAAAVKKSLISAEEAQKMEEQEALSLIFQSGLSTNPKITQLSGRGLGLAIVREKVDKVGGDVSVQTEQGRGATFRMILPLSLASLRGVLLKAGGQLFVVPTLNVERAGRVSRREIKTVENKDTVSFRGSVLSFVPLEDVLGLRRGAGAKGSEELIPYLILASGQQRMGFSVQEILNEQEVLVKGLGRQLLRVRNIAGATLLGAGQVVPVLNVSDLLKSAAGPAPSAALSATAPGKEEEEQKRILVVEDSITSRMLLKNILESTGYLVKTAVDGMDGLTALKTEVFDLLVSDIDMPRMNGFELTSRIRDEKTLSELPVVLVTALDSREDRERGIDVGASAYIVKSSFDQSNLLEVVERLI